MNIQIEILEPVVETGGPPVRRRFLLARRPCTGEQIAKVFGMHENEVAKYIGKLVRNGLVRTERKSSAIYFMVKESNSLQRYQKRKRHVSV